MKARIDAIAWGIARAVPYAYAFVLGMIVQQVIGGGK
jgi:hypothetical protein